MRTPLLTLAALGALALALSGCASDTAAPAETSAAPTATATSGADCAGVGVVVDFGILDAPAVDTCVDAADAVSAADVLKSAGVTTTGSDQYGDAIVCRVDDRPGADEKVTVDGEAPFTESCASMPPAYAYWALWEKTDSASKWDYAQEGVGTLSVKPGETLGLVYTTGTDTSAPGE